jgi:hypothetical protein
MNRIAPDVIIGDLLRGAGLLSAADVNNAVQVATKTQLPVGRVLVMLGLITTEVVQAALHGQSLVRDRLIERDTAIKALCVVSAQRVSFDQALRQIGFLPDDDEPAQGLGDLLLASELITPEQLADALNRGQHLGLPLGRILVLKGILSQMQIESTLEAQVLLRDEKISHTQALEALRTMRLCECDLTEALMQIGCDIEIPVHKVRLGELFVTAELVSETDLLTALEIGLLEGKPIGQVLIEFGFIADETVVAALRLQTMVSENNFTVECAAQALRLIATNGYNVAQAVAEVMAPEAENEELVGLLQLLSLAGLVTGEDCHRLLKFRGTSIFNVVLAETGMMSEEALHVAVRCQLLINHGLLTMDQAIAALHHWRWNGISLNDVLQNMGWSKDAPAEASDDEVTNAAHVVYLQNSASAGAPGACDASQPTISNQTTQGAATTIDGPEQSQHGTEFTDEFSDEDSLLQIHHTWGAPEVRHTWGIPEIHHSWH